MTNTSCELGHVILTSTRVPILLSEYQILNEYSPSISICFSPIYKSDTNLMGVLQLLLVAWLVTIVTMNVCYACISS